MWLEHWSIGGMGCGLFWFLGFEVGGFLFGDGVVFLVLALLQTNYGNLGLEAWMAINQSEPHGDGNRTLAISILNFEGNNSLDSIIQSKAPPSHRARRYLNDYHT